MNAHRPVSTIAILTCLALTACESDTDGLDTGAAKPAASIAKVSTLSVTWKLPLGPGATSFALVSPEQAVVVGDSSFWIASRKGVTSRQPVLGKATRVVAAGTERAWIEVRAPGPPGSFTHTTEALEFDIANKRVVSRVSIGSRLIASLPGGGTLVRADGPTLLAAVEPGGATRALPEEARRANEPFTVGHLTSVDRAGGRLYVPALYPGGLLVVDPSGSKPIRCLDLPGNDLHDLVVFGRKALALSDSVLHEVTSAPRVVVLDLEDGSVSKVEGPANSLETVALERCRGGALVLTTSGELMLLTPQGGVIRRLRLPKGDWGHLGFACNGDAVVVYERSSETLFCFQLEESSS